MATHSGQGLGGDLPTFPNTHSADSEDGFLAASPEDASLHYDFGTPLAVDQIRLWNYHGAIHGVEGNDCGVRGLRIYGSNDEAAFYDYWHDSWEPLAAVTAARAPADGSVNPYGDEHRFDECVVRFIRLQLDTNYGGANVGLAEIQFLASRKTVAPSTREESLRRLAHENFPGANLRSDGAAPQPLAHVSTTESTFPDINLRRSNPLSNPEKWCQLISR